MTRGLSGRGTTARSTVSLAGCISEATVPDETRQVLPDQATRQPYGCDNCGTAKDAHRGDDLACPGRSTYSRAVWRDSLRWVDDGHSVTVRIDHGNARPLLIHGEKCTPAFCFCRGEEFPERDADPNCSHCGGTGEDPAIPCWLDHFISEFGGEFFEASNWWPAVDLTDGPVPILYHGGWDEFEWRPKRSRASDEREAT